MRALTSTLTAVLMVAIGLFWMFVLLVGTNGFSERTGAVILGGNLLLVLLAVALSAIASGWMAGRLGEATTWSPWIVVPLTVVGVVFAAALLLGIGGFLMLALFASL